MFGIRGEFDDPAPLEWLVAGFRSLPLSIGSIVIVAAAYVFGSYF